MTDFEEKAAKNFQRRMRRLTSSLNKLLEEAEDIWPDAQFYLDGTNNLHLMNGAPHDDTINCRARQHAILATATLISNGGDW